MKNLNQYPFSKLDAFQNEAYNWALKEYGLIKENKTISGLNIDILSFTFASIYNRFLHISMNYPEVDMEACIQDFYGKENINKEWDKMYKYRGIVSGELLKVYKNEHIKIYNNLIVSVTLEGEDEYGDKVMIDPIDNQFDGYDKHQQVMDFVLNEFR